VEAEEVAEEEVGAVTEAVTTERGTWAALAIPAASWQAHGSFPGLPRPANTPTTPAITPFTPASTPVGTSTGTTTATFREERAARGAGAATAASRTGISPRPPARPRTGKPVPYRRHPNGAGARTPVKPMATLPPKAGVSRREKLVEPIKPRLPRMRRASGEAARTVVARGTSREETGADKLVAAAIPTAGTTTTRKRLFRLRETAYTAPTDTTTVAFAKRTTTRTTHSLLLRTKTSKT
jgi:hypothetical protein